MFRNIEGLWPLDCHSNFLAFRKYLRELLCSEPREIQHQKRAKNHRDLSARASLLRTTFISWWDRGHNQLNHLPRLHFSSLYQQMKPRQTAWTWSLQWKQQVEAEQPGVLKDSVFILAGWSQDLSITSTRQTAEGFPAQILFSHTLSVWDTSDLCRQIKSWIRAEAELIWGHLLFFFSLLLCADWYVLSFIQYVCGHLRIRNFYSLVLWKSSFQHVIYLWTWTHFEAFLGTILTGVSADGYAALQISFTWESVQMCSMIIAAISHFSMQQLSHRRASQGQLGPNYSASLYKTIKPHLLHEAKTHKDFHSKCQDTLYTFLTAHTGARFILFSIIYFWKKPNFMYLAWQEQHTGTASTLQRSKVTGEYLSSEA